MNDKYTCMTCGQRIRLEPPVKLDAACPACRAAIPYDVIETANEITPDMPVCACPRCKYEGRHHPRTLCPRCHERELSTSIPDHESSNIPLMQWVNISSDTASSSSLPPNTSGLARWVGVLELVVCFFIAIDKGDIAWAIYGIMAFIGCIILANILNHLHYISSNLKKILKIIKKQ